MRGTWAVPAVTRTDRGGWELLCLHKPLSIVEKDTRHLSLSAPAFSPCPLHLVTFICGLVASSAICLLSSAVRIAGPSQKEEETTVWILVSPDSSWRRDAHSPCSDLITSQCGPKDLFQSLAFLTPFGLCYVTIPECTCQAS